MRLLGEFVKQIRGITYNKSQAKKEYSNGYIPIYRAGNISSSKVIDQDFVYVPESLVKEERLLKYGDILIAASSGSLSVVGKAAMIESDRNVSFGAFCTVLRPVSDELAPRYLKYFFETSYYKSTIRHLAEGANINNLKSEHFKQLKISIPSLEEQKKIADILDAADSLRQKDKQLVEHYDLLSQSLFLDMFGDPVTNPMGWETKELKNYFDNKPRLGTTTPATPDGTIKLVRVGEIGKKTIDFHKCQFVSLDEKQKERNLLHDGDIILARAIGSIDHLGKASLFKALEYPVVFDSHVMRLRFKQNLLHPIFFYHWMKSHGGRTIFLKNSGKTAVQFNINAQQISRIEIRVPDPEIQNKFVESVNIIEKQKELAQQALKKSDDLFNSLLQRAFKGELTNS